MNHDRQMTTEEFRMNNRYHGIVAREAHRRW